MKTLVCYFSATGITKKVAEMISSSFGTDIFEIVPKVKYTTEDLDWNNKNSRSSVEMEDVNSRPEVESKVGNILDYDNIIIGFPVWWYKAPTIIKTFIEENDLTGKTIHLFVTSGGSSQVGSLNDLKSSYPNLNIIDCKRLYSESSKDEVEDWFEKEDLWEQ